MNYFLITICVLQLCYVVWKELTYNKERDRLINKLLAKNFVEYTNCDIMVRESNKKPQKPQISSKINI